MAQGIIKPTNIDKAWVAADPAAALMGYVSTILAVFGVFDWMGLDADQVAILGGAVLGVFATLRTLRERKHRRDVVELHTEHVALEETHTQLKKETGMFLLEQPVSGGPGGSEASGAVGEGPQGPDAT